MLSKIGGSFDMPHEWFEYQLCKLYGCRPSELSEEAQQTLDLHFQFLRLEEETGMMQGHG